MVGCLGFIVGFVVGLIVASNDGQKKEIKE
jgi:hypothetical protein